jgi:crotonobetainyl-CoA:carnitine CoA-transferase CaiB-like acyl-CoA transferase
VFEKAFLSKPATQWEALLDEAGVPASRVRKLSETLAEGQPQARGMLQTLTVGAEQTQVSLPGIGFRMNGQSLLPDSPPRGPGADTPRWQD